MAGTREVWTVLTEQRRDLWMVAALFFVALTLGGGGYHAPALVGLVEAMAVPVLVRFSLFADHGAVGRGAATALLLVAMLLIVGLLQLVPLPPGVWTALPARALLAQSLALQGVRDARWSISLLPQATRLSLLMMLPPIAMFCATIHLDGRERRLLCLLLCGIAALSVLVCLAQAAGSDEPILGLYGVTNPGLTVGFFANRNHQALFLDATILIAGAIGVADAALPRTRAAFAGLALLPLALCVLGTASRSGAALLAIALLALLLLWAFGRWRARRSEERRAGLARALLVAVPAALAVLAAATVVGDSYQGERLLGRFHQAGRDSRYDFWPDVLYVARLYAPFGAGFGSFTSVFDSAEPLASVNTLYVVHAHNDYVELFIECGGAAVAIVGGFLLWFGWRAVAVWRTSILVPGNRVARAASVVVLLVLIHSLVDYPLRTEANATLFAFACALLVPSRASSSGRGELRPLTRSEARAVRPRTRSLAD